MRPGDDRLGIVGDVPRLAPRAPAAVVSALLLLCLAAPVAGAPRTVESRYLWATINICDTPRHANTIGIRASMPGTRTEKLYMRFRVQYFARSEHRWHNFVRGGDTGFVRVGSPGDRRVQDGRNFPLRAPPAGENYLLRGSVNFQWRRAGRVTGEARKFTERRSHRVPDADPPGYSASHCRIR